mmetsp:Transcript_15903/g.40714  ORF Transcript_15903/g.40714 Transcript_15903/m.40714 type:complete len:3398 (+) Transcript_15903:1469-11662(+)
MLVRNCTVFGWEATEYIQAPADGVFQESPPPDDPSNLGVLGTEVVIPLIGSDAESMTSDLLYVISTFPEYGTLLIGGTPIAQPAGDVGYLTDVATVSYRYPDPVSADCPFDRFGYFVIDEQGARSPEAIVQLSVKLITDGMLVASDVTVDIDYIVPTVLTLDAFVDTSSATSTAVKYLDLSPRAPAVLANDQFFGSSPYSSTNTYVPGNNLYNGEHCLVEGVPANPCSAGAQQCHWYAGNWVERQASDCSTHKPNTVLNKANCNGNEDSLCTQLGIDGAVYTGFGSTNEPFNVSAGFSVTLTMPSSQYSHLRFFMDAQYEAFLDNNAQDFGWSSFLQVDTFNEVERLYPRRGDGHLWGPTQKSAGYFHVATSPGGEQSALTLDRFYGDSTWPTSGDYDATAIGTGVLTPETPFTVDFGINTRAIDDSAAQFSMIVKAFSVIAYPPDPLRLGVDEAMITTVDSYLVYEIWFQLHNNFTDTNTETVVDDQYLFHFADMSRGVKLEGGTGKLVFWFEVGGDPAGTASSWWVDEQHHLSVSSAQASWTEGEWHHVVAVANLASQPGSKTKVYITLYIDGALITSAETPGTLPDLELPTAYDLRLGKQFDGGLFGFGTRTATAFPDLGVMASYEAALSSELSSCGELPLDPLSDPWFADMDTTMLRYYLLNGTITDLVSGSTAALTDPDDGSFLQPCFVDPEACAEPDVSLVIATLPTDGSLYQTEDGYTAAQPISVPGVEVFNSDGRVIFEPASGSAVDVVRTFEYYAQRTRLTSTMSSNALVTLNVAAENMPPVLDVDEFNVTLLEGGSASFTITGTDPNTADTLSVVVYESPADGTLVSTGPLSFTYTPSENAYGLPLSSMSYRLRDNGGLVSKLGVVRFMVTAQPDPPFGESFQVQVEEGSVAQFSFASHVGDVDGQQDELFVTFDTVEAGGKLVEVLTGAVMTDGSFGDVGSYVFSFEPLPGYSLVNATYYLTDPDLLTSAVYTVTFNITEFNDPPVAYGSAYTLNENSNQVVVLYGNDTDDAITTLVGLVARQPTKGTLSDTEAPFPFQLTYTPFTNVAGNDTFTFRVRDDKDPYKLSNEATIHLQILDLPQAPSAYNNSDASVNEDGQQTIDLLATDPDEGTTGISYFLVSLPSDGTLYLLGNLTYPLTVGSELATVAGNPTELPVVYVPDPDFNGNDGFQYRVEDDTMLPSAADEGFVSVEVRPVPDPPIVYDNWYNGTEDQLLEIVLDTLDVDGDSLRTVIEELPVHGTLYMPDMVTKILFPRVIDGTTLYYLGALNGHSQPWPDQYDSFLVRVRDESSSKLLSVSSAVQRIRLEAVNDPPVCFPLRVITTEETAVNITLLGKDVDVGDSLVYILYSFPTTGTLSVGGTTYDETDIPILLPGDWFTYLPLPDLSGDPLDSLLYAVYDGEFEANCTVTFVVSPVEEPPTVFDQWISIEEDTQTLLTFTGSDPDENDAVVKLEILSAPTGGTLRDASTDVLLSSFPTGMLDTVTLLYVPFADETGSPHETLSFRMQDTGGLLSVNNGTFRINVTSVNDLPYSSSIVLEMVENEELTFYLIDSVIDPDNTFNQLTMTLLSISPGVGSLFVNAALVPTTFPVVLPAGNVTLRYVPPQDTSGRPLDVLDYSTTDLSGMAGNEGTVTFIVNPANSRPIAYDMNVAVPEGVRTRILLAGNDTDPYDYLLNGTVTSLPGVGALYRIGMMLSEVARITSVPFDVTEALLVDFDPGSMSVGASTAFSFTVTDSGGLVSAEATVSITIVSSTTPPAVDSLTTLFVVSVNEGTEVNLVAALSTPSTFNNATIMWFPLDDPAGQLSLTETGPALTSYGDTVETELWFTAGSRLGANAYRVHLHDWQGSGDRFQVQIDIENVDVSAVPNDQTVYCFEDAFVGIRLNGTDDKLQADQLSYQVYQPAEGELYQTVDGVVPSSSTPITMFPASVQTLNRIMYLPPPNFDGVDTFDYDVWDGTQPLTGTGTVTVIMIPVDDNPVAIGGNWITEESTPVEVTLYMRNRPPDSASSELYVSVVALPARGIISTSADSSGEITSVPHTVPVNTTIFYIPPATESSSPVGSEFTRFPYVACDSTSCSGIVYARIYVSNINDPPVLSDEDLIAYEDTDLLFVFPDPALVDPDGPTPLRYRISALPTRGTLYQSFFSDQDGNPVRSTAITNVDSDDAIVILHVLYAPDSNAFDYWDTFAYNATDDLGASSLFPAVVNITVLPLNDAPDVRNDALPVTQGQRAVINLADYTSDQEGDPITWRIERGPGRGELRVDSTVLNSFPVDLPGSVVSYYPGVVTGVIINPFANFTWTARDANVSAVATISLDVIPNKAPSANAISVITDEDVPVEVVLSGTDPEGQPLSSVVTTLPLRGSLNQWVASGDHRGALIQADENGVFSSTPVTDAGQRVMFTPAPDEFGDQYDTFTFYVDDGDKKSGLNTVQVSVNPVEDSPRTSNFKVSVTEEAQLTIVLQAFDPELDPLQLYVMRLPANPLYQVNADGSTGARITTIPAGGQVVTNPEGRVRFIAPPLDDPNVPLEDSFTFQAKVTGSNPDVDLACCSAVSTVTINLIPLNDIPEAIDVQVELPEDSQLVITLLGTDKDLADRRVLTAEIIDIPQEGTLYQFDENGERNEEISSSFTPLSDSGVFNEATQQMEFRVMFVPAQNGFGSPYTSFTYQVNDGKLSSLSATVSVDVTPVNDAPGVVEGGEGIRVESDTDFVINLLNFVQDVDEDITVPIITALPAAPVALFQMPPSAQTSNTKQARVLHDEHSHSSSSSSSSRLSTRHHLGDVALEQRRGALIDQVPTMVTDVLGRVIMATALQDGENTGDALFGVRFTDGLDTSPDTNVSIAINRFEGSNPKQFNEPWHEGAAVAIGLGGVIISLLAAAFIMWRYNKPKHDADDYMDVDFNPDEFEEQDDHDAHLEDQRLKHLKPRGPLEELLLEENLAVVLALAQVIDMADADRFARSLVNIFEHHGETLHLIEKLIELEVRLATSPGTLFRANSIASKVISAYTRLVGSNYLRLTLGSPIQDICDKQLSLEVDPRKLKSARDRAANMKRLLLSCQNFLDWILTSTSNAPFSFRQISNKLFTEVGSKFPQSKYSSVGGFLFLRFFCPAIISPEGHGVISEPPSATARRSLVLIAKAQQNLANGVTFGGKEEYMVEVNSFIEKNTEAIQMYFDSMVRLPKTLPYVAPMEIDLDAVASSLNAVHDYLEAHQHEVDVVLAGGRVAEPGTDTFRTERGGNAGTHDPTLSDFTLTSALDLTDDELDQGLDEDAAALNWAGEDSDEEGVAGEGDDGGFLEEAESGDDVVFGGASEDDQFYDDDTYKYGDDDQYQEVSEVYTDMELDDASDSDGEWGDGEWGDGERDRNATSAPSVVVDPREGLKSVLAILRND